MTDIEIKTDEATSENFLDNDREIKEKWDDNLFTRFEGVHIEKTYAAAITNGKLAHGLGWIPKDVLVSKLTAGTFTVNWDLVDKDTLDVTVSAACTVRLFVGSYLEVET